MLAALALCQGLHIGAAMLVFGIDGLLGALVPRGLACRLGSTLRGIEVSAVAVLVATACLWPMIVAAQMAEGWQGATDASVLQSLLLETGFGHVWLARLALVAFLSAAVLSGLGPRPKAVLAALVLGSLGLIGHAVMQDGPAGWLHRLNQAVHLLSAGAWVGGLVPLLHVMRSLADPRESRAAATALRRFSAWGHGAVALVVTTGTINTIVLDGSWPPNLASPYVKVLLTKICVVAAMVAVALFNRYGVVPRLRAAPVAGRALLRRMTVANLILGASALGLASVLSLLDPS